jgi:4-hydroxymandelate oxidase
MVVLDSGAMPDAPVNLDDYERLAAERLPRMFLDYFAGGSGDETVVRRNREAFARTVLRPRVLRGVGERDHGVTLLGRRHPWPLVIAPTAFARLAHEDGEHGIARAAATFGITQTLSTLSSTTLEDVAQAARTSTPAGAPPWFQLYVLRDRAVTRALVERAGRAGYEAIVLTVDAPLLGTRERDLRNGFVLPEGVQPENLRAEATAWLQRQGPGSALADYFAAHMDPSLTWDDVAWLRGVTPLPVLVKGIVRGDDAELAVAAGAAGVIVSNHGGRQLDSAPATLDVLREVAEAVAGRADVLLDGGVRRGTDIVKALASGARAVLIGRPVLWALAASGDAGVRRMLELLTADFDQAMALCGCRSVADIDGDLLARAPGA